MADKLSEDAMAINRPRLHRIVAGWAIFVPGLIILPTPVPIGLMMTLFGLSLLASESVWVQRLFQKVRLRFPKMNRHLDDIHPRSPKIIQNLLEHTHPRHIWHKQRHKPHSSAEQDLR